MKNKHRIKQGLSLLLAGGIALTNLGAALPAFAEDAPATPETAEAATPETAEADATTPNLVQITENLYDDLPDAPTGSYLGSMGLPVATGETKIGISAWVSDLYDGVDAHMDADALNADENTVTIGKTPGTDYAIVPLLAQVEYPADGAVSEIILPDDVELLSYLSTDYEPIPADEQEQTEILHQTYSEQSAAATGLYVKASADFTAQLVYTDSDGSSQSKAIHVQISEDAAPTQMYADTGDDSIAVYAAGPTPPYATGKITSIAKEGGTWLIWFNGQEAYCCSHGLNGQPKGCPTYSFSHVSRLEPGQYTPGNHYANQVNIWGGLGQLSLDMLDDRPVVASLEDDPAGGEEQPDILGSLYDETQQWIMENYPDSYAAQTYIAAAEELINGTDAQSGENGYYTYIYNPPAGYAWQVVALVGEEIAGGTEIPDVPSVPKPKYYSAAWTAPAQTAGGSFDLTFTVNTDKVQLNTLEKVDGAVITVTPSRTGGSVEGGSWQMTPAGAQTITTSGHTQDDSFHLNGGDGSATWTVHYEVSKISTSTLSGQEGPFASQAEADAAAEAAKNAAIGQLQNEAQGMVDAAIASARAQLANITFAYDEITIPHGFDSTPGALGSHQTITVPANSSNDYKMQNDEWSVKVSIDKIDSETKQRIKGDAEFKIFEWDVVRQCYIPFGGYNRYKVERQSDGTYKVINHSDYAGGSDDLFYTQRNEGKFVIVESRAPSGYYGDWTDATNPGTAGSVLGKRAYAFEITKAQDGQTIWLGNADYNADITTANSGGTLIDTGEGIVTITFGSRNADKTYATDPTGIANNEDSYTMHADSDKMQNDRVLGNILLTKVDLNAARYLAAGSNGDTTLEGAVYDLYAADTIEHPDGASGVVDYSKTTDASGTPLWHTTVLTNGGWDTDYLPILQKDRLVASAKITDGKLAFANLYMGRYYLVERATGLVLPIDGNGKLYVTGKYPQLNKKLERTGKYSSLATKGGEYTDYIYKNQYSAVAESRKLNGSKAWDEVLVFDLINPAASFCYNPFVYVHDDREVLTLIENLIQNTTPSHSKSSDPFWEKSETALLQALMLYLLHEAPPEEQNFSMVMEMIAAAEVHEDDDNYQSPLDILFERLEMRDPDSIACKQYRIFKQAAGKTAKSILVSVGVRLAAFNLPSIAKLTMTDELHLQELGERKIALFCCIPDSDKSLNYLVGMIYTQLIQTLYRQADRVHKGRLPVPVHCLMDEYANISLPKDTFLSALATMRSRAIFCSIIVQNMAQLKAMYKDDWESLVGLCDEFLYLGGTEKETHKYVSELLGKETISTTSYNQSKGRSGSYSINHQQSGRDLMTPDEVRLLDNSKCILFIRGERPVVDLKYNLLKHPNIRYTEDGGAAPYDYTAADNALDDLPGAPENYELLDMDDFLPAEAAEMKPTIQRIRRST